MFSCPQIKILCIILKNLYCKYLHYDIYSSLSVIHENFIEYSNPVNRLLLRNKYKIWFIYYNKYLGKCGFLGQKICLEFFYIKFICPHTLFHSTQEVVDFSQELMFPLWFIFAFFNQWGSLNNILK